MRNADCVFTNMGYVVGLEIGNALGESEINFIPHDVFAQVSSPSESNLV